MDAKVAPRTVIRVRLPWNGCRGTQPSTSSVSLRSIRGDRKHSADSPKDPLICFVPCYVKQGIETHRFQTDSGTGDAHRLSLHQTHRPTAFRARRKSWESGSSSSAQPGRHREKGERSHRKDMKWFCKNRKCCSFDDFISQLATWHPQSSHLPISPPSFLLAVAFLKAHPVLHD